MGEPVKRKTTEQIFVHCSASNWGSAEEIRKWHIDPPPQGRGWADIGYHYVVTNGFPTYLSYKDNLYMPDWDGKVQPGRPEDEIGSHVEGENHNSIGVCLIGSDLKDFSPRQIEIAGNLIAGLCKKYGLPFSKVFGHSEVWTLKNQVPHKQCPVIPMEVIRKRVYAGLKVNGGGSTG